MNPKLKAALKKEAKDLDAEEKTLIGKHWDMLNADLREKFADAKPEGGEEGEEEEEGAEGQDAGKKGVIDVAGLKKLISKSSREDIEAKAEEIATTLVNAMEAKVKEGSKRFLDTGEAAKGKNKEHDEITRKFLRALIAKDVKTLKELGKKAIDTTDDGSGADAGFLIPEPLENAVLRVESVGYGLARQIFNYNLLTQGNTKRVTALGAALSVFWVDEGEKKPASQPSFSIVTLALKKLVVIVPMTEEVVEDSGVNLTDLVAQLIREAIDKEVDLQFFMGDGTVWTGIFKDTSIPSTELAANEDIGELRPEHILAVVDATPLGVNGKWLMHRTVLSRIRSLRQNADGTGEYMYNPIGGQAEDYGTLAGYPVILSEAAPTATQATDAAGNNVPIAMFGDFKRGVAYGEKSDVQLKLLDQATITDVDGETVINLAEQDMIGLRAVQRVGFKVTLPSAMRRLVAGD